MRFIKKIKMGFWLSLGIVMCFAIAGCGEQNGSDLSGTSAADKAAQSITLDSQILNLSFENA